MITMTLGELSLSDRVTLAIKLGCGGALTPDDVLHVARVLELIALAAREWTHDARSTDMRALQETP